MFSAGASGGVEGESESVRGAGVNPAGDGGACRSSYLIESERGDSFYVNDVPADAQEAAGGGGSLSTRLSPEQMQALLVKRVEMMKQGKVRDDGGMDAAVTDQFRVYSYIVETLEQGRPLRLMTQASAGTGNLVSQ